MLDLLDSLISDLENNDKLKLFTSITPDYLSDGEAISLSFTPNNSSTEYLDKSKVHDVYFQLKVKSIDQRKVINTSFDILDYILKMENLISIDDTFEFVSTGEYVNPTLAYMTEQQEFVYSTMFYVSIYMN